MWRASAAPSLAAEHLSSLGNRWLYVQGVGRAAQRLHAEGLITDDVLAAAWLHDVGYASALTVTGFHPVDGARYLQGFGAPVSCGRGPRRSPHRGDLRGRGTWTPEGARPTPGSQLLHLGGPRPPHAPSLRRPTPRATGPGLSARWRIAAQHNLFVRIGADHLTTRFGRRAENYQTLLTMLMGRVAGPLGRGQLAVADTEAAQTAMEDAVGTRERASDDQLAWLRRLFTMTDAYVAARTRQGIEQRRYFVWNELTLSGVDLGGMKRAVRKYEPIDGWNHPNLYAAVKALAPTGEPPRLADGGPQRDEFTRVVQTAGELDRARRCGANRLPMASTRGRHHTLAVRGR